MLLIFRWVYEMLRPPAAAQTERTVRVDLVQAQHGFLSSYYVQVPLHETQAPQVGQLLRRLDVAGSEALPRSVMQRAISEREWRQGHVQFHIDPDIYRVPHNDRFVVNALLARGNPSFMLA